MMTLSLLLYDDNSNSFVVIAVLTKICCSVKWQSMHKTSVSLCVCVHMCVCAHVCLNSAPFSYPTNYGDQDVIVTHYLSF